MAATLKFNGSNGHEVGMNLKAAIRRLNKTMLGNADAGFWGDNIVGPQSETGGYPVYGKATSELRSEYARRLAAIYEARGVDQERGEYLMEQAR
jgi:hypothetical protein